MSAGSPFRLDGRRAIIVGADRPLMAVIAGAITAAGGCVVDLPPVRTLSDTLVALANLPRFDILVNVAAFDHGAPVQDILDAQLDEVLEETIEGSFLISQAAALRMGSRTTAEAPAAIVHVGTPLARVGARDRSLCCMAMHALRGLTMASATELGVMGIRVNLLEANLDGSRERALAQAASADSIAAGVVYLASPAASAMTGAALLLDAGWTAR